MPEPRGVDTTHADGQALLKAVGDNYAVLVGGELRAGSKHVHESVAVAGGTLDYRVDANGFWQVHRMAPVMLADHVLDLVRRALDGRKQAVLWDLYSGLRVVHAAAGYACRGAHAHAQHRGWAHRGAQRSI